MSGSNGYKDVPGPAVLDPSMSLVGRLEDLSVGEILQIVSMSKRSGLLRLESGADKANLFIKAGKVMYGARTDAAEGVLGLLARHGLFKMSDLEPIRDRLEATESPGEFQRIIQEELRISPADFQGVLKQRVERLVYSLFYWEEGTFSFQLVDDEREHPQLSKMLPLFLEEGIGAQFLVMEGARLKDEKARDRGPAPSPSEIEGDWSEYEDKLAVAGPAPEADESRLRVEIEAFEVPDKMPPIPSRSADVVLLVSDDDHLGRTLTASLETAGVTVDQVASSGETLARIQEYRANNLAPRLVMELGAEGLMDDTVLGGLEIMTTIWDLGFNLPAVILHRKDLPELLVDKLSEADTISTLVYSGPEAVDELADTIANLFPGAKQPEGEVTRPTEPPGPQEPGGVREPALAAPAAQAGEGPDQTGEGTGGDYYDLEGEFRDDLETIDLPFGDAGDAPRPISGMGQNPEMVRLSSYVSELSRPDISGEITLLTLRFASVFTTRAILFLVRKNDIKGLGQFGVNLGDSQDADRAVRSLELPLEEGSVFTEVIDGQRSYRGSPRQTGTETALLDSLGGGVPSEIYVGPIISMGKVAVVLYGDDFPGGGGLAPTDTMDIFLSHAGLALDRAFLEMKLKSGKG